MRSVAILASAAWLFGALGAARAQVTLYSNDFQQDTTSTWNVNGSTSNPGFSTANFFFDYSTLGIPAAPNSGTGALRGLRMDANIPGGAGLPSGVSVSPRTSPIPAGLTQYTMRFDAWLNYNGPLNGGGTGSTQHLGAGFGTDGLTSQYPGVGTTAGSVQGITVAADGDGGAAATSTTVHDYGIYKAAATPLTTGYRGTSTTPWDDTDPIYSGFGNKTAPPSQLGAFPQQSGNTAAGALGFGWHTWTLDRNGNTFTWSIDGVQVATEDLSDKTFAGTNFFLGQFDFFASVVPAADQPLLFGLVDNLVVTTPVPEPSSLALVGLAVPFWLRLRRRRG